MRTRGSVSASRTNHRVSASRKEAIAGAHLRGGAPSGLAHFVDGAQPKHIVTEAELLNVVALAGRKVNDDWRTVIAHCMRALGWSPTRDSNEAVFQAIREHHEWSVE